MSQQKVEVHDLNIINVENGDVLHAIKESSSGFYGFGEVYFSEINYGKIKGWKKHKIMIMNLVVPVGKVRFYIHDELNSSTTIYNIGLDNYKRITIPNGYWVAFEGLDKDKNLILNFSNIEHDPNESVNSKLQDFPLK